MGCIEYIQRERIEEVPMEQGMHELGTWVRELEVESNEWAKEFAKRMSEWEYEAEELANESVGENLKQRVFAERVKELATRVRIWKSEWAEEFAARVRE